MKLVCSLLIFAHLLSVGCGRDQRAPESEPAVGPAAIIVPVVINVLSGVALHLLTKEKDKAQPSELKAIKIGEAMPKDVGPNDLSGGERMSKEIDANYKNKVNIKYRIEYMFGVKHKDRPIYIKDITFVPLKADINKEYGVSVSSLSQSPVNDGDAKNPKYSVDFTVTFNLNTPDGSKTVTHRFRVRSGDGKLIAVTPELN